MLNSPSSIAPVQGSASSPFILPEVAFATEELSKLAQDHSGAGAWVWQLSNNVVSWSPKVYEIFEAPNFDGTLESFQRMVLEEDQEPSLAHITRALTTRSIFSLNFRAVTPTGNTRQLMNVGRALYDDDGNPKMVVGLVAEGVTPIGLSSQPEEAPSSVYQSFEERLVEFHDHLMLVKANPKSRAAEDTDLKTLGFLLERLDEPSKAFALAKALLARFGSLADILSGDRNRIKSVQGVREAHIRMLDMVQLTMESVLQPRAEPIKFDNNEKLIRYLRVSHAYQYKEQLRVIFLNVSSHIINDEVMQIGTVDHTPVYVREILKRALELSAKSIILVHNHPSGNPLPSEPDILLTEQIAKLAKGLGILVRDHIIIGKYGHCSLRELGLFELA